MLIIIALLIASGCNAGTLVDSDAILVKRNATEAGNQSTAINTTTSATNKTIIIEADKSKEELQPVITKVKATGITGKQEPSTAKEESTGTTGITGKQEPSSAKVETSGEQEPSTAKDKATGTTGEREPSTAKDETTGKQEPSTAKVETTGTTGEQEPSTAKGEREPSTAKDETTGKQEQSTVKDGTMGNQEPSTIKDGTTGKQEPSTTNVETNEVTEKPGSVSAEAENSETEKSTNGAEPTPELIFVHVLWRHGDRGPIAIYPTDPYQESAWPNGLGELTEMGMRQQFKIGQRLHKQYINCTPPFLSKIYSHREIYVRSTDVNRTLTSAMANMAGMFPHAIAGKDYPKESDEPEWPVGWVPIPVHTMDLKYDYTGSPFRRCPRAQLLEREAFVSKDFNETVAKYQDLLAYLSNVTGLQMPRADERFYFVYDTLNAERHHNFTRPEWFTEKVEEEMHALRNELFKYRYGNAKVYGPNSELIRLRGGAVLGGVIDRLRRKWECVENDDVQCFWYKRLKFYGLSAHDITLAALLIALEADAEIADGTEPQYGATATFELYRVNDEPHVKLLYSNSHSDEPQPVTHFIPGCPSTTDLCPLGSFIAGRKHFVPLDIEEECGPDFRKRRRRNRGVKSVERLDDEELGRYFNGYTYDAL